MGMFSKTADAISSWGKKEAPAGDRLPYSQFIDDNVVLLRDGSLMISLNTDLMCSWLIEKFAMQ
jgi:type IV secretion system protein VirB4